ncbi:YaaC family protein [Peribacillus sp. B-H-3]|uniref:YaaC family protein n=1 Tax=Peribacillus sp. B-H-3 TaxID=3400420 RepID=UPI003B02A4B6
MQPLNTSSNKFIYFSSASSTQSFLRKCYERENNPEADLKSFENCYPFMYYLEHGQTYYNQAQIAPLSLKPVLLFYGFVQLLKACLLTLDSNYPESTTDLAHGVTTRKRKKQQYEFMFDEVKVQKNGLFTNIAEKMFHMKHLESEKYTMEQLLREIPELKDCHLYLASKKTFQELKSAGEVYQLPIAILSSFNMTENRFNGYLESKLSSSINMTSNSSSISLSVEQGLLVNQDSPIHYHMFEKSFMLSLNKSSPCYLFPELMIHYLVLYNLSMISRYETEWWSELLKTAPNDDYPYISEFLNISQDKTPFLVFEWLMKERLNTK